MRGTGFVASGTRSIGVPEHDLDDLRDRLRRAWWADDIGNDDWRYGVERGWLRDLVDYWVEGFDWRLQESLMNRWPNEVVDVDGVPVHHLRASSPERDALPLVLTHGWPWTFWDYKNLIGPLSDPVAHGGNAFDAFDVVVPSLPGHGFSVPLPITGIDVQRIAGLWRELMCERLGYERFGAVGGDWGALVTAELGRFHPESIVGCHLLTASLPQVSFADLDEARYAEDERWMVDRQRETDALTRSHFAVQRTDPQTLAYALTDSPLGTAAWVWERRRAWADCGGELLEVFDRDFLCATASLYWLTGSIGSSLRLYAEQFRPGAARLRREGPPRIEVPTGVAVFPKDVVFLPQSVVEERTDLRRWTVMDRGGHFGPAEQPALVVDEIRAFFRPLRAAAAGPREEGS